MLNLNKLTEEVAPNLANRKFAGIVYNIVSNYLMPAAGLVMFMYLIFGAFEIMTSAGNPKSIASGKGKITNAVFGFIIIFVAYWLVQVIATAFGLKTILDIFQG